MKLAVLLGSCESKGGGSEEDVSASEDRLGKKLPPDYRRFLLERNGAEGFIGRDQYVSLWPASDLADLNSAYAVSEFVPGLVLIGSDGGETGYGFIDIAGRPRYVAVPLVGMSPESLISMGDSLVDLLEHLIAR